MSMAATHGENHHSERVLAAIAHEAATFIHQEAGTDSLITVMRAAYLSRGERVAVFVSVYPEEKMRSALAFLERQREAFSDHLKTHTRLGALPRVEFLLDNGEHLGEPAKS